MLTVKGVEIIYLLHQLVENIYSRRLNGDFCIPSVEVDPITEERIRSVLAEMETADDWWLQVLLLGANPIGSGGFCGHALPSSPGEGVMVARLAPVPFLVP